MSDRTYVSSSGISILSGGISINVIKVITMCVPCTSKSSCHIPCQIAILAPWTTLRGNAIWFIQIAAVSCSFSDVFLWVLLERFLYAFTYIVAWPGCCPYPIIVSHHSRMWRGQKFDWDVNLFLLLWKEWLRFLRGHLVQVFGSNSSSRCRIVWTTPDITIMAPASILRYRLRILMMLPWSSLTLISEFTHTREIRVIDLLEQRLDYVVMVVVLPRILLSSEVLPFDHFLYKLHIVLIQFWSTVHHCDGWGTCRISAGYMSREDCTLDACRFAVLMDLQNYVVVERVWY